MDRMDILPGREQPYATMSFRRLEDRIRELCAVAAAAKDGELEAIQLELRSALSDHTERLRNLAFLRPLERRAA